MKSWRAEPPAPAVWLNHCMEPRVNLPGRPGFIPLSDEDRRRHHSLLARNYPVGIKTFSGMFAWVHLGALYWAPTLKIAMERAIAQREELFHASYRVPGL